MNKPFSYSYDITLDKNYFSETYDASVNPKLTAKDFIKTGIFALIGFAILLSSSMADNQLADKNVYYLGFFFIGLSVVEGLSIKFKRTWWLWRQMMSKAANNTANITLNDQGINTLSKFVSHTILWTEVYRITESDNGFLIHLGKQQNYLSKRGLSDEALSFIRNKMH